MYERMHAYSMHTCLHACMCKLYKEYILSQWVEFIGCGGQNRKLLLGGLRVGRCYVFRVRGVLSESGLRHHEV